MIYIVPIMIQRERHKLNSSRHHQVNVRKVRTRKEEWERKKMGIEFISDIQKQEQAGGTKESQMPKGFVFLFY